MNKYRKLINFIVDELVSQTKRQGMFFNPPYINEAFVFEVLYQDTFSEKQRSYSSLPTNLIYFKHYCKKRYGLSEDECMFLWEEYMKEVNDRLDFHIRIKS